MLYLSMISILILGLIVGLFFWRLKKGVTGLKVMLLGINITLIGGIIVVDTNSYLRSIEYLIVLIGLIITVIGFVKKD